MNGGYQMIDFKGFDITGGETVKIDGIATAIENARLRGKMVLCYNMKNNGVPINAAPTAIDANGNLYFDGLCVVLTVGKSGASLDNVTVKTNMLSRLYMTGVKNYCPTNTATTANAGNILNGTTVNFPAGDYVLTFDATNFAPTVSAARYELTLTYTDNTTKKVISNKVVYEHTSGEFTAEKPVKAITVYSGGTGNTYSNIMIRPAYTDAEYVAYTPTNAELNARVAALENA